MSEAFQTLQSGGKVSGMIPVSHGPHGEGREQGGPFKVLTISLSPPSESLSEMVNLMGFRSVGVRHDADLLPAFRRVKPDLLLVSPSVTSKQIGDLTGVVGHEQEGFPVLCISDDGKAVKQGDVCDKVSLSFLPKRFQLKELKAAIEKMIKRAAGSKSFIRKKLDSMIIGETPEMVALKQRISQLAKSDLTVLITGESGTGKEVVAKAIHGISPRFGKPFVKVNSAGFPSELFESELFGYQRGAFTGAYKNKPGKFKLAHSGTILLDEIGEIPLLSQAKLLHVLEDSEFSPLGSTKNTKVDARVIAATNAGLNTMVKTGKFRLDLYYRLSVVSIHIPPLRKRRDDIGLLCDHFLEKHSDGRCGKPGTISDDIRERFYTYDWPGNVRQLENAVRSVVALGNADNVLPDVPPMMERYTLKQVCKAAVCQAEKKIIEDVLSHTGWNRKEAATVLKTSYRNLLNKIKEYDIAQTVAEFACTS